MSQNTNTKTPNPQNPSSLKPRYEIRKLGPEHEKWVSAIVAHSNGFHSPVWPVIYPDNVGKLVHDVFDNASYLVMHQINSGLSYGVFDTAYEYKTDEAKSLGGKLYWNRNEPSVQNEQGLQAEGDRLLEQMDFPLVSVVLSYDSHNSLDMEKMGPLVATLPHFGLVYQGLGAADARDPKTWQATGPGQVLFRNASATRHDYEGEKIMAGVSRWLMREADQQGFRSIQIECLSDAITHIWSKPEPPYKGAVVSEFHTATYKDEAGNFAFAPAQQRVTKCFVNLKPVAEDLRKEQ